MSLISYLFSKKKKPSLKVPERILVTLAIADQQWTSTFTTREGNELTITRNDNKTYDIIPDKKAMRKEKIEAQTALSKEAAALFLMGQN